MPRRLPELHLTTQYPGGKNNAPTRSQVRRWIRAACSLPADITVRFVDATEGQLLNQQWRNKDYATNVLTFGYGEGEDMPLPEGLPLMGDLVLCRQVVEREAAEQGKALDAHYAHLSVHGMLHLQGFDHLEDPEAEDMEAREREILAGLGYADPYAGER